MTSNILSSFPAIPEIFLLAMTCIILLVDLFVKQKEKTLTYNLSQFALVGTIILTLPLINISKTILFNGNFIADKISGILELVILGISILVFIYSRDYVRDRNFAQGEYYILSLFSILGMLILV